MKYTMPTLGLIATMALGCTPAQHEIKYPELSIGEKSILLGEMLKEDEPLIVAQHGLAFMIKKSEILVDRPNQAGNMDEYKVPYLDFQVVRITTDGFPVVWIHNAEPYSSITPNPAQALNFDDIFVCHKINVGCKELEQGNPDVMNLYGSGISAIYDKIEGNKYKLPDSVKDSFRRLTE